MTVQTKSDSLCPECGLVIKSEIYRKKDCIRQKKKCRKHGIFDTVISEDAGIYSKLSSATTYVKDYKSIILPITHKCNLSCNLCYSDVYKQKDMPIDVIYSILSTHSKKVIVLSGGEPTMRDDLTDIIQYVIKSGNTPIVVTNGMKLKDEKYVLSLKSAGLKYVIFSLNSLDDKVYKKTNKMPLTGVKLKSLDNLKKYGFKVILSLTLMQGINEKSIKDIFNFCIRNTEYIRELRIRSACSFGRHYGPDKFSSSKLLNIVCNETGIEVEEILREIDFWHLLHSTIKRDIISIRTCAVNFHLKKKNGHFYPLGRDIPTTYLDSSFKKYFLFLDVLSKFNFPKIILKRALGFNDSLSSFFEDSSMLRISLRSWQTPRDIDLTEMKNCPTGYYTSDGDFLPFCLAQSLLPFKSSLK